MRVNNITSESNFDLFIFGGGVNLCRKWLQSAHHERILDVHAGSLVEIGAGYQFKR